MRQIVFIIVGIFFVIGAIAGGFLMEHGKLMVLVQPSELVIIFGAAIGAGHRIKHILKK